MSSRSRSPTEFGVTTATNRSGEDTTNPSSPSKEPRGGPALNNNNIHHISSSSSSSIPPNKNRIMPTMTRKRRQGKPLVCIVGCLVCLVFFMILLENMGNLDLATPLGVSTQYQKILSGDEDDEASMMEASTKTKFWRRSPMTEEVDQSSSPFSFWNLHSQKKRNNSGGDSSGQQQQQQGIPSIQEDDRIPTGPAGSIILAADALDCRDSVIDFVINATDLKDECEGLRKAYSKNCADEEVEDTAKKPPTSKTASFQRSRRMLKELNTDMDNDELLQENRNPVVRWQVRLASYRQWFISQAHHFIFPDERYPLFEDEVMNHWEQAEQQVMNQERNLQLDQSIVRTLQVEEDATKKNNTTKRNKQETAAAFTNTTKSQSHDAPPKQNETTSVDTKEQSNDSQSNRTTSLKAAKPKLPNLSVPTKSAHLSEKTLEGTLMLHQDEQIRQAVQNYTNTTTNAAAVDAAASSKAVSDSVEFVENVFSAAAQVEARTCCMSVLNVYHENCTVEDGEELSDSRLFIVVVVIALCGLVKSLIRHFQIRWLPEAAGCILVGVFAGWGLSHFPHHDISFDGNWFLRILVPPIVFEAALSIDKRSFNRHVVPILLYAVCGTLLATGLTAFVVHEGSKYFRGYCETIPFIEALTFGALISSIDPIAVLSVLSNMGMTDTDTIYVVIFGESLLNDGVAIVLFQTLEHFLDDNMEVDSQAILAAAIHFLVVAIGSLLVGLASGICCTIYYWMMHGCQTPLVEVLMFCCWALVPYYVCDGIEWSGIVAVVAAGFVMDINVVGEHNTMHETGSGASRKRRRQIFGSPEGHLTSEAKTHIGFVTEIIATMMETAIFAYLGLFLFSSRYHWNFHHSGIAITACCVSRAIMIPTLSSFANSITRTQQKYVACNVQQLPQQQHGSQLMTGRQHHPAGVVIDRKMQMVLWFAGLRGAMSFALVENIPIYDTVSGEGTRFKSELKAMTSACIMFTVFVLGGSTFYIMDVLGLAPQPKESKLTSTEPETELAGLLPRNRVVVDDESQWNGDDSQEFVHIAKLSSPKGTFRQRTVA